MFGPIWCPDLLPELRCPESLRSKTAAQRVFRPSCGAQESLLFEITSDRHGSCSRRRSNPAVWDTSCDSLELDANGDSLLETPRGPLLGCQRNRVNSNPNRQLQSPFSCCQRGGPSGSLRAPVARLQFAPKPNWIRARVMRVPKSQGRLPCDASARQARRRPRCALHPWRRTGE